MPTATSTSLQFVATPTGLEASVPVTKTEMVIPTIGKPLPTTTQTQLPTATVLQRVQPVQILTPGDGSQVISPLFITVLAGTERNSIINIELRDQEGRLLARQLLAGISGLYTTSLEFEIAAPDTPGRLIVIFEDSPGHVLAVDSVGLKLLSSGSASIEAPAPRPVITIQNPVPGESISGGTIEVSGLTSLDHDQPLKVQLISPEGKILGQRLAGISQQGDGDLREFSAAVPYKINQATPARLVVFQVENRNNYLIYLTSVDVTLNP